MALSQDQENRIREVVKEILLRRIDTFPAFDAKTRNAPFHAAILEYFKEKLRPLQVELPYLIAIASWLHGLNTSLGTGFEKISHILSGGYKREFTNAFGLMIKRTQARRIEEIIRDLKSDSQNQQPDIARENGLIFRFKDSDPEVKSLDFTVDVYIERKDEIVAIELKSVRPNSGEGRGEKQKILYGKAALKLLNPDKTVSYYIGFPFDPTGTKATEWNKVRFFDYLIEFKKFFAKEEVLLAGELWDFLSGQHGTMEAVLDIITKTVRQLK